MAVESDDGYELWFGNTAETRPSSNLQRFNDMAELPEWMEDPESSWEIAMYPGEYAE